MKFLTNHKNYLSLIVFYLAVAVVFTYPLITHMTTHTLGVDEDSATHVWYLWWFRWAVVEGHSNPFWTDWIFYPQLINRTFDVHTWTLAILSLPFQYLLNVVTASNLIFLFSLVFSALGAFTLSLKLTTNKLAAIVAGLIYGFFPYIFAQVEDFHTNLITVWFYPWYLWTLLKTIEKPNYKNALMAGVFLGLQILNDWTYTSFLLISGPLVYLFFILTDRKKILNLKTVYFLTVKLAVALLIGSPLIIAALLTVKGGGAPGVPTWVQDYYGADLAWYLTPSLQNPFLNQFASYRHISMVESTLYLGLINLTLITVALLTVIAERVIARHRNASGIGLQELDGDKRSQTTQAVTKQSQKEIATLTLAMTVKKVFSKNSQILLPLLLFGFYFSLSLGPNLHFFDIDRVADPHFKPNLFMPFTYFQLIPFIGGIKEPTRFAPFVTLGFALLVAFSFRYITDKFRPRVRLMLFVIVIGLILFEFYPGTAKLTDLSIPVIYNQIKNDKDEFAVLDLPVGFSSGNHIFGISPIGSLQFYQSAHEHKIFRGTVARIDPKHIDYYRDIPLLHYLANPYSPLTETDQDKNKVKEWFVNNQVKYIVVHEKKYEERRLSANEPKRLIEKILEAEKFYEKDQISGYKVY